MLQENLTICSSQRKAAMRTRVLAVCFVALGMLSACDHEKGPVGPTQDHVITRSRVIDFTATAICANGTTANAGIHVVIEATGHGNSDAEAEADANRQLDAKAVLVYTSTQGTANVNCGSAGGPAGSVVNWNINVHANCSGEVIVGGTVVANGDTKTTDNNGHVTFTVAKNSLVHWTAKAISTDYQPNSGDQSIGSSDLSSDITLTRNCSGGAPPAPPVPTATCIYNPSQQTVSVSAVDNNTGMSMTTNFQNCPWSVSFNVPWLSVAAGFPSSFSGGASVLIHSAANTTGAARTGTVTFVGTGGKTANIIQSK